MGFSCCKIALFGRTIRRFCKWMGKRGGTVRSLPKLPWYYQAKRNRNYCIGRELNNAVIHLNGEYMNALCLLLLNEAIEEKELKIWIK